MEIVVSVLLGFILVGSSIVSYQWLKREFATYLEQGEDGKDE